jgi:hypothetical protein
VIKKDVEKILKYKEVTIALQRIRNVRTRMILVIIGANRSVPKFF